MRAACRRWLSHHANQYHIVLPRLAVWECDCYMHTEAPTHLCLHMTTPGVLEDACTHKLTISTYV